MLTHARVAARNFGHQAALGGLDDSFVFLGRQQAAQGSVIQDRGADAGEVRGGVFLSRQVLKVFFD